jgi:F-type H+-transporting ATPase subunit delta
MKTIAKDERGFVSGVIDYLRSEGKGMGSVPRVQSLLSKVTQNARKAREAVVQTAVPLTRAEESEIQQALSHIVGHEVNIDSRLNTDLIAGIRIQMADWIVDTSFKGQLEQMATIFI